MSTISCLGGYSPETAKYAHATKAFAANTAGAENMKNAPAERSAPSENPNPMEKSASDNFRKIKTAAIAESCKTMVGKNTDSGLSSPSDSAKAPDADTPANAADAERNASKRKSAGHRIGIAETPRGLRRAKAEAARKIPAATANETAAAAADETHGGIIRRKRFLRPRKS